MMRDDRLKNRSILQIDKISQTVYTNMKWWMFFSAVGYIIYAAIGVNYLTNPDSSVFLVYKYSQGETVFGRIGLQYIDNMFGKTVAAPLSVAGTVMLYSIIIVLVTHILEVNNKPITIMLLGLFIYLSPVTSSTITYHCFSIPYTIGYLFAVLAVYMLKTMINRTHRLCVSSILLMASLTLYQAYLPVAIVLVLLVILLDIIRNKKLKSIIEFAIDGAISVISGTILYIVLLKVTKTQLASERSFDSMGRIGLAKIPYLVLRAYHNFFQFFWGEELINNHFLHRNIWNVLVLFGILVSLGYLCIKKEVYKNRIGLLVYIMIIVILPIAFEFISIMAPDVNSTGATGIIIVPAMSLFYCLFPVLLDEVYAEKYFAKYAYVLCIPVLIVQIAFTALFINQMWLNLNQMKTLCVSIADDIWDQYGYSEDDRILITGNKNYGNFVNDWHGQREYLKGTIAYYGYSWDGWIQNWCYTSFMEYYCGIKYNYGDIESYDMIMNTKKWKDMPIYPNKGSIEKFEDLIVVKLSECSEE